MLRALLRGDKAEEDKWIKERRKWLKKAEPLENKLALIESLKLEHHNRHLALTKERRSIDPKLDVLFPDKGGTPFFSQDFRDRIVTHLESFGYKEEAERAFDFYDMLARTYNTGGRSGNPFKYVEVKPSSGSVAGFYSPSKNYICLVKDDTMSSIEVTAALIHEMGHWLENQVLPDGSLKKNLEWLLKEQEHTIDWSVLTGENLTCVPRNKQPNITVRLDNYSQRYYVYISGCSTELISTALEYLYMDPETFALRCPKQFELLLRNLESLK